MSVRAEEKPEHLRVGVIDSGWDRTIEDHRVLPGVGLGARRNTFVLEHSDDDHDQHGHGTSCSDLVLQMLPEARIVPIRIFDTRLETSPAILLAAIDWAVEAGIPLVNLSVSTARTDVVNALYAACERARRAGTIIVAASGPEGVVHFPASFEPVIGVSASTPTADRFSISHSVDEAYEFQARAARQTARGLRGVARELSGISFATPIVTGHVGRLLISKPNASLDDVRRELSELV